MSKAGGPVSPAPLLCWGWVGLGHAQALRRCRRCWLGSGGAPAALSPSSSHRSSMVDDSCQSLLSHSDISYDRTEDDVVRSDPAPCPVWAGDGRAQIPGCCSPHTARPAPSTSSAFQDVDMTVVRALKRKAQERQVGGGRWGTQAPGPLPPRAGGCQEAGRGGNLLALGWERRLSANRPRSIETPLPCAAAQLGSSIIHPHVRASCTQLRSHLCIAGLACPCPSTGGLGPHGTWCGAGGARAQDATGTFCGAGSTRFGLLVCGC